MKVRIIKKDGYYSAQRKVLGIWITLTKELVASPDYEVVGFIDKESAEKLIEDFVEKRKIKKEEKIEKKKVIVSEYEV
jgi:hypothetical protein